MKISDQESKYLSQSSVTCEHTPEALFKLLRVRILQSAVLINKNPENFSSNEDENQKLKFFEISLCKQIIEDTDLEYNK